MKETDLIDLSHGGGGKRMDQLIEFIGSNLQIRNSDEDIVGPKHLDDASVFTIPNEINKLVVTTDSHTVNPIFFRGGNIGDLTVAGALNDIFVMGAIPKYLTLGMIIEEGFSFQNLQKICQTIGRLCEGTHVRVLAGDTKVMPKGMVSEIVINSTAIGFLYRTNPFRDDAAKPGDNVIITGSIGDHGASLMALREGMKFETTLDSDVKSLWPTYRELLVIPGIRTMKDPTRGGLASAINEIATKSDVHIEIIENQIPINPQAQAICDILGLEIFHISNEGKAVIVVSPDDTDRVMNVLKSSEMGKDASIIGSVKELPKRKVYVITEIGGTRFLDKPYGEPIPRVC